MSPYKCLPSKGEIRQWSQTSETNQTSGKPANFSILALASFSTFFQIFLLKSVKLKIYSLFIAVY